jgi:hypothetical protein
LVVAGIVFILLAIAGQFKLLEIPPLVSLWQKWLTGIIGSLLILGGLLIYLSGNMTLWLKICGRYGRNSTESSNLAFLSSLHWAPHRHCSLVALEIQRRTSSSIPTSKTGM